MESKELVTSDEARQAHEDEKLRSINGIADVLEGRAAKTAEQAGVSTESKVSRTLTVAHLQALFNMTTGSLLKHGLIMPGETQEVYDTGELRSVSDINSRVLRVSEEICHELGVDEMGDWAAQFYDRKSLLDFLVDITGRFETKLTSPQEVNNG